MTKKKTIKPINKLPNKLSELILVALKDLSKVEKRKGYEVDMAFWHCPSVEYDFEKDEYVSDETKPCKVCLAGSVMACEYDLPRTTPECRADFSKKDWNKFCALDEARTGHVSVAVRDLFEMDFIPETKHKKILDKVSSLDRYVTPYDVDKKLFKRDMRKIAKDLAAVGL